MNEIFMLHSPILEAVQAPIVIDGAAIQLVKDVHVS